MIIESGIGNGKLAAVDEDNRVLTASFNIPFDHLIAKDYQKTFYAFGEVTPVNGTVGVIYLKNENQSDIVAVKKFKLSHVGLTGGTAVPNASNYFNIEMDAEYTSGGSIKVPVNLTSGSPVLSGTVCYENGFNATGSTVTKNYPSLTNNLIDVDGSLLIPPGKAIAVNYVGDNTGGVIQAGVEFSIVGADSYSG